MTSHNQPTNHDIGRGAPWSGLLDTTLLKQLRRPYLLAMAKLEVNVHWTALLSKNNQRTKYHLVSEDRWHESFSTYRESTVLWASVSTCKVNERGHTWAGLASSHLDTVGSHLLNSATQFASVLTCGKQSVCFIFITPWISWLGWHINQNRCTDDTGRFSCTWMNMWPSSVVQVFALLQVVIRLLS